MKLRSISARATLWLFPVIIMFSTVRAYSYDILFEQNNPDSIIGWEWDTLQEDWKPDSRIIYTFNENGQIVTDNNFNWQGNKWSNSNRKTNTYDDAGNLVQEKYDRWLGLWTNNSIYEYTFSELGDQTSVTRRVWADTGYQNGYKYIYGYDNDHNRINKIRQWWLSSGVWDSNYKETYTYDDQGNFIHELHEEWRQGWQPDVQIFYSYNDFNQLDTSLEQIFITPGFRIN